MIQLNDQRWSKMNGGYRKPYNPTKVLEEIEANGNSDGAWEELWDKLHHQSDVDIASYASVPQLVRIQEKRMDLDWNFYHLICTIELERKKKGNPALPKWLEPEYMNAWKEIVRVGAKHIESANEPDLVRGILASMAIAKGCLIYGLVLSHFEESEVSDMLESIGWSDSADEAEDK